MITCDQTIEIHACAKLNLALAVAPPESDGERKGWHKIAGVFVGVDLCDRVRLTRSERPSHAISWADGSPVEWEAEKDLAVRAQQAIERRVGRPLPAHMEIVKSIPAGGGLGGGSSDAAAVLIGLTRLYGLELSSHDLAEIGGALGSDVPFFIDTIDRAAPRAAVVGGFGESIRRLSAPACEMGAVLVMPDFGCATPAVYGAFDQGLAADHRLDTARVERVAARLEQGSADDAIMFNDLAGPAVVIEPRLRTVIDVVSGAAGRPAHVSGSGSTLFVLADREDLGSVAERVRTRAEAAGVRVLVKAASLRP